LVELSSTQSWYERFGRSSRAFWEARARLAYLSLAVIVVLFSSMGLRRAVAFSVP